MRRPALKRLVVIGATLVVIALAWRSCSASKFRSICYAIESGELTTDAAERLESAGGGYVGKLDKEYHWTRSSGWFKTANCLVTDDKPPASGPPDRSKPPPADSRVIAVRFVEGDDLL